MSNHKGVVIVAYDLPVEVGADKKKATQFRTELRNHGYMQLQKSVYVKLLRNGASSKTEIQKIKDVAPSNGSICAIPMSLTAFRQMETICGDNFNFGYFSDDIVCV